MYYSHYYIIENAYHLIMTARYETKKTAGEIWKHYISNDYLIDQRYRYFYYHYDSITNNMMYDNLRDLVENIYTNEYLNKLSVAWNKAYTEVGTDTGLVKQQDFYSKFVRSSKERVIVIISDALRYEVGQSLMKTLQSDEKCTASALHVCRVCYHPIPDWYVSTSSTC